MSSAAPGVELSPEQKRTLDEASHVFSLLSKGMKAVALYRNDPSRHAEALKVSHAALQAYCAKWGPLVLRVETQDFALSGIPGATSLLPPDSDRTIPYKFFSCGIRQLLFRAGVTLDELLEFTLVAMARYQWPTMAGEDALSMLWRAELKNIEYVVVEGFKLEGVEEGKVEVEVGEIYSYLHNRLRTKGGGGGGADDPTAIAFARVSGSDLGQRIDNVEAMRTVTVGAAAVPDELRRRVQQQLDEDESWRLMPKVVRAVFQGIDDGVADAHALENILSQLLDGLLVQDDVAGVNELVSRLDQLAKDPHRAALGQQLKQAFAAQMGNETRLSRLGAMLSAGAPQSPADVVTYLTSLEPSAVPAILEMLKAITLPESRLPVLESLVTLGREQPDLFVKLLQSDQPQTVKDMLTILDRLDVPNKLELFAGALSSGSVPVRLAALEAISRAKGDPPRNLILRCLGDADVKIRLAAARALAEQGPENAARDLLKLVKDPGFAKRTLEEQQGLYAALGATRVTGALYFLASVLQQKPSLLHKKRIAEEKLLAIGALAEYPSIPSFKLLQSVAALPGEPEIAEAAKAAAEAMRKILSGAAPQGGG